MKSHIVCRTCCAEGKFTQHSVREMNFGSEEPFWYLECANCGSLQVREVPVELSKHYPPQYLGSDHSFNPVSKHTILESIREFIQRQRTAYLLRGWSPIGWAANEIYRDQIAAQLIALRTINIRKKQRILDVGCGPGYLLRRLQQSGYIHLMGQDPYQSWTVTGISIHKGNVEGLLGEFDLIMLHHSLEHTPDPLQLLIQLKSLLAPHALVLVRIPLAGSEAWMEYNVNWYQIDAPRHLVIPSRKGMERLVQLAGYEIVRVKYDSDETQFLCSEQYRRGIHLRDPLSYYNNPHQTVFSRLEIIAAKARARSVNRRERGDQACFYLQVACTG